MSSAPAMSALQSSCPKLYAPDHTRPSRSRYWWRNHRKAMFRYSRQPFGDRREFRSGSRREGRAAPTWSSTPAPPHVLRTIYGRRQLRPSGFRSELAYGW